ncbi:MAG TPA: cytochrome c [Candidatus Tectomicrobia bacterium]|nr:cytochrome c [Candidatus Tectomicrobia bacterium]
MSTPKLWWVMGIVAPLAMAGIWPAAAQLPTYGVGRPPTAEEVRAWDLTIRPDGQGLPPGRGTAALGKPIYAERCASCHGETGEDPKYSRLVGGQGTLATDKPIRTIGSFWQYAPTLWSYIRRAQPYDNPGSLTPDQVYAVTAYLLHRNGIIGEQDVMDAQTLPQVKMPNRDGFVPDSRPDVGPAAK